MDYICDRYLHTTFQGKGPIPFKKSKGKNNSCEYQNWLRDQFIKPLSGIFRRSGQMPVECLYAQFEERDFQDCFPIGSTYIKLKFTLKKPYLSKDDRVFYLRSDKDSFFENPIARDKLTGFPLVKPSTWKGHLRFAAGKVHGLDRTKKGNIIRRLFGSEPNEPETLCGRLHFFPTFFERTEEKDVITPLNRDKRIPRRGPIEIEKVEGNGTLHLFYLPYPRGTDYTYDEVGQDLAFLAQSIKLMLYTYGFSAKKTSGFGVTEVLERQDIQVTPKGFTDHFLGLCDHPDRTQGGV
ncbi:MAG: RAMP superfamily CRISPR-associated protein [Limnochordia bacterium]|nr:RAMP superfamily CRISPR-associated protein [Limnochordia bacterium]